MTRITTIAWIVWMERLRRKDIYVLLILCGAMLFGLAGMDILGMNKAVRYVYDVGLLLAWLFSVIITIGTSAQQIPHELSKGTIFPLLAKPVSRAELIVGKWLGAWSVSTSATVVFYVLLGIMVGFKGGLFSVVTLFQGILAHSAALAVISAIAIAFSTRSTTEAAATLTAVFSTVAIMILPQIPNMYVHEFNRLRSIGLMIIYYALPHFELFDMRRRIIHDWGSVDWKVLLMLLFYALIYSALFLLLAWLSFRNRRFPRDKSV
ncbi:MAG: ABC transporter permease [Lentisphaerae bacterium]|nr:ABC transporter permease [Lentisphaerota bacterium]